MSYSCIYCGSVLFELKENGDATCARCNRAYDPSKIFSKEASNDKEADFRGGESKKKYHLFYLPVVEECLDYFVIYAEVEKRFPGLAEMWIPKEYEISVDAITKHFNHVLCLDWKAAFLKILQDFHLNKR